MGESCVCVRDLAAGRMEGRRGEESHIAPSMEGKARGIKLEWIR